MLVEKQAADPAIAGFDSLVARQRIVSTPTSSLPVWRAAYPLPRYAFVAHDCPVMLLVDECVSGNHIPKINPESAAACSGRIRDSKDSDSSVEKQCVYNVMMVLT